MNAQQDTPLTGVEMRGLRARVVGLLRHEPWLNERQITVRLHESHDDVAEACGRLLVDGRVRLRPDGRYGLVRP